jgi:SHAQKYF class myb-like DNA-binding protein
VPSRAQLEALQQLTELSLHGSEGAAARAARAALAAGGQAAQIPNLNLAGVREGGPPVLPSAGPARSQRLKRSRLADGPPAESVSAHGGAQAAEKSLPGLPYKERLRWTPELRGTFDAAVEALGGLAAAQPAQILNLLRGEPGGAGGTLTLAHLKSHLQKCRLQAAAPGSTAAGRVPGAEAPGLMSGLWQLIAAAPLGEAEAEVEAPAEERASAPRRQR